MPFDRQAAKQAGYTDSEIDAYLRPPIEDTQPGIMGQIGRQAGLTGRYLAEGALGLPTMLANVPSQLLGMAGVDVPSASQGVQSLLSGLPQPETAMERGVAAPSRALAGAASTMGIGGLLGGGGQVSKGVGETLLAAPGGQAMSAIGGGLGSQAAAEAGAGPVGQTLAGLLGGTAAPMAGYRAMGGQAPGTRQTAEKMVGTAMGRDVLPEEAAQITALGPQGRMIDIGGPNVRQLAQTATAAPGKAKTISKTFLDARSKASTQRLINDAKKFAGTNKEVFQSTKNIIQERKALSKPLYDLSNRIEVDVDESLRSLMQRPAMRKSYASAITKARNDVDWPKEIKIPSNVDIFKEKITIIPKGRYRIGTPTREEQKIVDVVQEGKVPLPILDYVKRSLDDEIGSAIKSNKMDKARIFYGLKRELLSKLDTKYPKYREAREVFSDRSAMLSAMETGKKILRSEPDEMMEFIADMPASEKEMFVVGAMKAITDKLKGTVEGSNAARKIATPLIKERIRPAFADEESFNKFVQGLERENVFMQSKGILGGSPTQERLASGAQLADESADIAINPTTGTMRAIRNFIKGEKKIPERVRDEIAEILFLETMVKPGTFSNKTVARMTGYKIPRKRLNELAGSLISVTATQEQ